MEFVLVLVFSLAYHSGTSAVEVDARFKTFETCQKTGELVIKQHDTTSRFVCVPVPEKIKGE